MKDRLALACGIAAVLVLKTGIAAPAGSVAFDSPGFPPSHMDAQGRLMEDWGALGIKLSGEGVTAGTVQVHPIKLDGVIPTAQADTQCGAVTATWTAYRAPAFPAGVDVLTVRVQETKGRRASLTLRLDVPATVQTSVRSAQLKNRTVLLLPRDSAPGDTPREWGSCDNATAIRNWAKPEGKCDPAFRNIRAGMGGVPIQYRFSVTPKSQATVALGLCESRWAESGKRVLRCRVEGAPQQEVDPVANWGRHKPGVLAFRATDENGNGQLEITVQATPTAGDRNPILNAIWIFPVGGDLEPAKVVSGAMNAKAIRFVDVGGDNDQTLYQPGKLEFPLKLAAGGSEELTFLVACRGGSAPTPDSSAWTPPTLRLAAVEVWKNCGPAATHWFDRASLAP